MKRGNERDGERRKKGGHMRLFSNIYYVLVYWHASVLGYVVVREQLEGISSFLASCEFQVLNSGHKGLAASAFFQ